MNSVRKGYTKEKLCRDQLKKEGWMIAFKSIRWRFGTIDFAKLFDVVALNGLTWRFISCKHFSNGNYYLQHQQEIKLFKDVFGLPHMEFELWLWDKPRWTGRGKDKEYNQGKWIKIRV